MFVLPPSMAALETRLRRRAQDSAEIVAARMAKSAEEMSHWPEYDYVIVNRDIDESVAEVAGDRHRRAPAAAPASSASPSSSTDCGRGERERAKPSRARASAQNSLDREFFGARRGGDAGRGEQVRPGTPSVFRLERSILRRWPKAAAVTRSRAGFAAGASGAARGISATTLDVTFGGGTKARGGRSNRIFGSVSHCTSTDSRP